MTIEDQLKSVRSQLDEKKKKIAEQAAKNKAIMNLSSTLTNGYASSINIIIDISHLLQSYKDLIDELMTTLSALELSDEAVETLQTTTQKKLAELEARFKNEMKNLEKVMSNSEKSSEFLNNLENIKQSFQNKSGGAMLSNFSFGKNILIAYKTCK